MSPVEAQFLQEFPVSEIIALVGLVFTIVTTMAGGVWFLSTAISRSRVENAKDIEGVRAETESVHQEIKSVGVRMAILERDNYTKPEAEAHALRLALNNPQLKVPDPRNPDRLLHHPNLLPETK